ncbi:hypothetical protein Q8W71_07185 [Methylobacterium sp. NEAU 140]|uniref:hypothetical protein n=1 Tax=Methylobacterium sp. NEAU 140 TaxID=3064945 RepID=UPI002736FDE8|nr:hypothetical protein [Methylobacterium sp. NEAU 140]MDP4022400.1 hypothetical protein [Methylobacterium sp. NEAU 140]
MADEGAITGCNVFVDGSGADAEIAALVARALALPTAAALTDASTFEAQEAAWGGSGWVRAHRLEAESEFRVVLDIVLYRESLDTTVFPALARQHGLTVAWDAAPGIEHDWHFHVAYPDGRLLIRWFTFEETDSSYAVRTAPPLQTDDRP